MKIKPLLLLTTFIVNTGCTTITDHTNLKVGAGYKFDEPRIRWDDTGEYTNHPISARIEWYVETDDLVYGLGHHSQWFQNGMEFGKTEIFIDYKVF